MQHSDKPTLQSQSQSHQLHTVTTTYNSHASDSTHILLLLLVGLPASGKTTLIQRFIQANTFPSSKCESQQSEHPNKLLIDVFNSDDVFDELMLQQTTSEAEGSDSVKLLKQAQFIVIQRLCAALNTAKNSSSTSQPNHCLIVDDALYLRSMRHDLWKLARDQHVAFRQVYCRCPFTTCLERNRVRRQTLDSKRSFAHTFVTDKEMVKLQQKFEQPNLNDIWEKSTLTIDTETETAQVEWLLSEIHASFGAAFVPPINTEPQHQSASNAERLRIKASLLHQIDCALRKAIHTQMKECCKHGVDKSVYAAVLNQCRLQLLKDLKNNCEMMHSLFNHQQSSQVKLADDSSTTTTATTMNESRSAQTCQPLSDMQSSEIDRAVAVALQFFKQRIQNINTV